MAAISRSRYSAFDAHLGVDDSLAQDVAERLSAAIRNQEEALLWPREPFNWAEDYPKLATVVVEEGKILACIREDGSWRLTEEGRSWPGMPQDLIDADNLRRSMDRIRDLLGH